MLDRVRFYSQFDLENYLTAFPLCTDSIIGIRSKIIEPGSKQTHNEPPSIIHIPTAPSPHHSHQHHHHHHVVLPPAPSVPPIITITSTEEELEATAAVLATATNGAAAAAAAEPLDGMLDRISHDLDYLLNRTIEIPVIHSVVRRGSQPVHTDQSTTVMRNQLPPPPPPATLSSAHGGATSTLLSVHEVIIEESEE